MHVYKNYELKYYPFHFNLSFTYFLLVLLTVDVFTFVIWYLKHKTIHVTSIKLWSRVENKPVNIQLTNWTFSVYFSFLKPLPNQFLCLQPEYFCSSFLWHILIVSHLQKRCLLFVFYYHFLKCFLKCDIIVFSLLWLPFLTPISPQFIPWTFKSWLWAA